MNSLRNTDKALQFGCGFVFGLIVFGLGGAVFYYRSNSFLAFVFIGALIFGLAAMYFGSDFWRAIKNFAWWWT